MGTDQAAADADATRASKPALRTRLLMRAIWYEQQGPAAEVLPVGELPDRDPVAPRRERRDRRSPH